MSRTRLVVIYLGGTALAAAALFAFVVAFSATETRLQCAGTLTTKQASAPTAIFLKIHRYRWWVHLWSSSDGALWLEVPGSSFDYYGHLVEVGDQLQISRSREELGGLWGYYSSLSNTLVLETGVGTFNGHCTKLDALTPAR
jgi:hypothetical protein